MNPALSAEGRVRRGGGGGDSPKLARNLRGDTHAHALVVHTHPNTWQVNGRHLRIKQVMRQLLWHTERARGSPLSRTAPVLGAREGTKSSSMRTCSSCTSHVPGRARRRWGSLLVCLSFCLSLSASLYLLVPLVTTITTNDTKVAL